jgi:hypothetical protein
VERSRLFTCARPGKAAHNSRKKSIIEALTWDARSCWGPTAAFGEYERAAQLWHVVCQIGDDPIHTLERQCQVAIAGMFIIEGEADLFVTRADVCK